MNMKFSATIVALGDETSNRNSNSTEEGMLDVTSIYTYMLGRFLKITSLSHKNLCKHLELVKCQTVPNGFVFVSEHYSQTYLSHDSFLNCRIGKTDLNSIFSVAAQICSAIEFCHENNMAIGSLDLSNLLVVDHNNGEHIHVKLSRFGICYITGDYYYGIRPAMNSISYQPPEYILNILPTIDHSSYFWTDIWSFGIMLIELFTGWRLVEILDQRRFLSVFSTFLCRTKTGSICADLLDAITMSCPSFGKKRAAIDPIRHIIEQCLNINPGERPSASEIMQMLSQAGGGINLELNGVDRPVGLDEDIEAMKVRIRNENELQRFGFDEKTLKEIYFLWKLCGSTVENILARKEVIKTRPPLSTLPCLIVDNALCYGNGDIRMLNSLISTFELPINNLMERLRAIPYERVFLSFELKNGFDRESPSNNTKNNNDSDNSALSQSLVVKERDIDYQFQRMRLFRRLLSAWPNKAEFLREASRVDIPPVYRGPIWAALLGVLPFDQDEREEMVFFGLDTLSEHISDRQLQVDIPRCHQYDELMSSPMAHYQLKLLLKAILLSRSKDDFVYWQGLDSLSAPFLVLHFNDLATAYRCLNAFIDNYLRGFFLKDNASVIRNYLAKFMLVIEFSDPELFTHLISLDFHPELFAIPWFLTCFAHVLPLHKLFHLWDALLLADAEFPLFIGVAILLQMRSKLITSSFNEAILLFSDLPDLHIDNVVCTAKLHYNKWRVAENLKH